MRCCQLFAPVNSTVSKFFFVQSRFQKRTLQSLCLRIIIIIMHMVWSYLSHSYVMYYYTNVFIFGSPNLHTYKYISTYITCTHGRYLYINITPSQDMWDRASWKDNNIISLTTVLTNWKETSDIIIFIAA
jgi:hypothetical protein